METNETTGKDEQEPIQRDTPRGEDPARLNDLNEDAKPAPPQPTDTDQQQPAEKPEDTRAAAAAGQRPKQMLNNDKPTNPPHTENDGTLWATENTNDKN
jgi:hypothetical protein